MMDARTGMDPARSDTRLDTRYADTFRFWSRRRLCFSSDYRLLPSTILDLDFMLNVPQASKIPKQNTKTASTWQLHDWYKQWQPAAVLATANCQASFHLARLLLAGLGIPVEDVNQHNQLSRL